MTAKAAAGFTLRTHKGIERGGGLLPALGAALLLAGILLVMGAYRLFSWLCSRGLTDTLTWVLGAAALVLAALGLLLASRSFRRLKELHL